MDDRSAQVGWTDAQWNHVRQVITEEATRARVAGSFLPVYGPLPPSTQVVPSERMLADQYTVDDVSTTRIIEISAEIDLSQQQVNEEELASALLLFRRAANVVARVEDWLIFNGQPPGDRLPPGTIPETLYKIRGGEPDAEARRRTGLLHATGQDPVRVRPNGEDAENLVPRIVGAVMQLEAAGHLAPFACVLGTLGFRLAYTPEPGSLVLPRDRIEPFLGRELLRSSTLPNDQGVVVSLAGDPVDLAVAVDASPQFLYVNQEARYVFRVYERFALRIKEPEAIVRVEFETRPSRQQRDASAT